MALRNHEIKENEIIAKTAGGKVINASEIDKWIFGSQPSSDDQIQDSISINSRALTNEIIKDVMQQEFNLYNLADESIKKAIDISEVFAGGSV